MTRVPAASWRIPGRCCSGRSPACHWWCSESGRRGRIPQEQTLPSRRASDRASCRAHTPAAGRWWFHGGRAKVCRHDFVGVFHVPRPGHGENDVGFRDIPSFGPLPRQSGVAWIARRSTRVSPRCHGCDRLLGQRRVVGEVAGSLTVRENALYQCTKADSSQLELLGTGSGAV
jgi:hypothetical protein